MHSTTTTIVHYAFLAILNLRAIAERYVSNLSGRATLGGEYDRHDSARVCDDLKPEPTTLLPYCRVFLQENGSIRGCWLRGQ